MTISIAGGRVIKGRRDDPQGGRMLSRTRSDTIAYHEAGHAVAAWALGYRVKSVTIVRTAGSNGQCRWSSPLNRPSVRQALEGSGNVDRARPLIEDGIIVSLAGPIAQRRHNPNARWRRSASGVKRRGFFLYGSDYHHAVDLIARLYEGQQKVMDTYWRYLEARSESLVDGQWTEIESLAGALIERKTLKTDEILTALLGTARSRP